jgi:UDP-N-acetylmuramyl pentapeptide phosphotransferase/UDP-N-acetylglucosamine-1-phosphate transferase
MNWYSNPGVMRSLLWFLASFAMAVFFTWAAIRYARRNNLLDLPGQRRSHSMPTPRGGGIGIVLSVVIGMAALAHFVPAITFPVRLVVSITLIATVGWIDDHRPLPAWVRLFVHCIAVAIWLTPLILAAMSAPATSLQAGLTPLQAAGVVLLIGFLSVWSINLHNFMDGIDGLLAMQGIFVLTVLVVLCLREKSSTHPLQLGMWAAAIAGFLPFNFPRARVFMGDVGSGIVGLLIAVAIVWQMSMPEVAAASGFVAVSAFAIDASCTLLSRMLRGRRWYSAHREHLYQWMTRAGMSHARVVASYASWNLLVVMPVLWWINRVPVQKPGFNSLDSGYAWAAALYAVGVALWIFGKRRCAHVIGSARHGSDRHAPA